MGLYKATLHVFMAFILEVASNTLQVLQFNIKVAFPKAAKLLLYLLFSKKEKLFLSSKFKYTKYKS